MGQDFSFDTFRRIHISDKADIVNSIAAVDPVSCEMNFLNLFIWSHVYDTLFQIADGLPYIYFAKNDALLFPGGRNANLFPSPEKLRAVSDEIRSRGGSGKIYVAPPEYVKNVSGVEKYFSVRPPADSDREYIYDVEKLAGLHGTKLAKKKNLIHQFKRTYPDFSALPLTKERAADCRALTLEWVREKEDGRHIGSIDSEEDAIERLWTHFDELSPEGICVYAGGRLAAFSIFSRIGSDIYDEHFEKTASDLKGAAQVINNETALALTGKARLLNREQDLGVEGLRQAKMSYAPEFLTEPCTLTPL